MNKSHQKVLVNLYSDIIFKKYEEMFKLAFKAIEADNPHEKQKINEQYADKQNELNDLKYKAVCVKDLNWDHIRVRLIAMKKLALIDEIKELTSDKQEQERMLKTGLDSLAKFYDYD